MTLPWQEKIVSASTQKGDHRLVPWRVCREAAREAGIPARKAELWACENGICPSRYERSLGTLGLAGQARLLASRAAVIGCGGLGGWIVEILARAGVGEIVVVDGDVFGDSNLNRQSLSREDNIGGSKALEARKRVEAVNGAVEVTAWDLYLTADNASGILEGCRVAVDALDSNEARATLLSACRRLGIPMVHGAIGGFWGQACVILPGDRAPWELAIAGDRGVEDVTGNPPFTPAFVASLEAAEAVRLLSGAGEPLSGMLWCDLKVHEYCRIDLRKGAGG
ncbi:MAG: HesA/MoeB/ThiF family protein [Thermovirgaceae bacterium]|nr:HesA/MoeB/ThiF family protein [Synergistales bacterium]